MAPDRASIDEAIKDFLKNQAGDGDPEARNTTAQRSLQELLLSHARGLKSVLGRLAPFGFQILVSSITYGTGLCLIQLAGAGLRVSCATPIIGPCLGAVGVGAASVFSGHMTRHARRELDSGRSPLQVVASPFWRGFSAEEAVLDALSGLAIFKACGGQFRRLMPSDLRAPGAYAHHSVPLSSAKYATEVEKGQLISMFKRDGCHHCGSRRGPVVGDHIPPTKLANDIRAEATAAAASGKQLPVMLRQVRTLLRGGPNLRQAYYAQCRRCSLLQAELMRHSRRSALVFHRWIVPPGLTPGILVGFRHYCDGVRQYEPHPSLPDSKASTGTVTIHKGIPGSKEEDAAPWNEAAGKGSGIWGWITRMDEPGPRHDGKAAPVPAKQ